MRITLTGVKWPGNIAFQTLIKITELENILSALNLDGFSKIDSAGVHYEFKYIKVEDKMIPISEMKKVLK